ncbi:MAG: hypothetical protein HZC12_01480 [Nitrospirae bacterium]|nr:hypothetical protein [Nitrospirota bacterium]
MKRFFALFLLSFFIPGIVHAFSLSPMIPGESGFKFTKMKVGSWAEYQMKGPEDGIMKYSVVGKDGENIWFEMKSTLKNSGVIISKVLISDSGKVLKLIVKEGNAPAMEMPVEVLEPKSETGKETGQSSGCPPKIDKAKITVKAGSFDTTYVVVFDSICRTVVAESWLSSNVPTFIVSAKMGDTTLELTRFGMSGAVSEITEKPQKFQAPPSMPMKK